jgi:hypothetical protein
MSRPDQAAGTRERLEDRCNEADAPARKPVLRERFLMGASGALPVSILRLTGRTAFGYSRCRFPAEHPA